MPQYTWDRRFNNFTLPPWRHVFLYADIDELGRINQLFFFLVYLWISIGLLALITYKIQ